MDRLVRELFKLYSTEGDVGIEIEVEGHNLPNRNAYDGHIKDIWRIEGDGSLRGEAWEYVLNQPVKIKEVAGVITELKSEFKKCRTKITESVRAGVHIHINVQELTIRQLATMVTCYFALEEVLIKFCAPSRKGNHFCLRAQDAEYLLFRINSFFNDGKVALSDDIRYAAINLLSLKKYGSLEFRALETPLNFDKVGLWAEILYTLKKNSLQYDSPTEVIESMSQDGGTAFVKSLLGKHAALFKKENVDELVIRGVRNAQTIAYGTDWYGKQRLSPKRKRLTPSDIESMMENLTEERATSAPDIQPPPSVLRRREFLISENGDTVTANLEPGNMTIGTTTEFSPGGFTLNAHENLVPTGSEEDF